MRSLRSLTWGLGLRNLVSRPDRVSGSYELRRLSERPGCEGPTVDDYYELYWAHLSPDGDFRSSLSWGLSVLLRPAWRNANVPLRRAVVTFQVGFMAAIALAVAAVATAGYSIALSGEWDSVLGRLPSVMLVVAALLFVMELVFGSFLRRGLSDAMRYLEPRPANIEVRQEVREEGLKLLRTLHADNRYRRIVLVGHSLGSVIALDLIRCLWDELRHPDPRLADDQEHVGIFDEAADHIDAVGETAGGRPVPVAAVERFQQAQHELWHGNRRDGVPWLITDFVSIGSPLAYAPLLLDERPEEWRGRPGLTLADRQRLKEYPRCPPVLDDVEPSRTYTRRYPDNGSVECLKVGHTAAPFAPTRWTNLYMRGGRGLAADLLGGPVAPYFGPGVRDVPVRTTPGGFWGWLRRWFPWSHASYWWSPRGILPAPRRVPLPGHGQPPAPTVDAVYTALNVAGISTAQPSAFVRPQVGADSA